MALLRACFLFAVSVGLGLSFPAYAWREVGHRTVAEIAWRNLSAESKFKIAVLLEPSETIVNQSTWLDDVRNQPEWKFTFPYHFADFDEDCNYVTTPVRSDGDAIQALIKYEDLLRSAQASREEKAVALKALVHIVGDIHQPLHVGRKVDRGGNLVPVKYRKLEMDQNGKPLHLHMVWDYYLIDDLLKDLGTNSASDTAHLVLTENLLSRESPKVFPNYNYLSWVFESQSRHKNVYAFGQPSLGSKYYLLNKSVVQEQLLIAGLRLAALLENAVNDLPLSPSMVSMRKLLAHLCSSASCIY